MIGIFTTPSENPLVRKEQAYNKKEMAIPQSPSLVTPTRQI